ncbi:IS982 family transposase [Candidatus Tisiphia endosymbiont of Beris chalybata]|uniref:IS982 family transposase n=1 Tax=Candidatus Tisiphia endosymbiont of Beris chalybata TaxID=3066262 RepID=UPI00312C9429
MTLEEFIITVYCFIEEKMTIITKNIKVRKAGFPPCLSDVEALTMEVVGEFIGLHQDKQIWEYFKRHFQEWFPNLKSRPSYVKQCSGLLSIKNMLLADLFKSASKSDLHMIDGVPIPVINLARATRGRCFKEYADYGYCASKDSYYYGFLGHVLINEEGRIAGFMITPANGSEREALQVMSPNISGMVLGDKGYLGQDLKDELATKNIDLQTPLKKNMKDNRSKNFLKWITATRRLIETVIGQLTERFAINAIRVKSYWHLQSRIARKLLAHTIATFLTKSLKLVPTQLEKLVTC